ncbi:uncharacterized protein LOC128237452 [Mya arenaria]|uniref:uncharacterized protein LOC128237452 n=1 Tax=Mya arenaria TaxID=6604 RepID=UPI0022E0A6E7|nr:uncharacterized protein LOC128237452 [Mya arenaria]
MCILNGRNNAFNNFTSVSTKGMSVVDYCFVSHEKLPGFVQFNVIQVTDLINRSSIIATVASSALPDHSLLVWDILLERDVYNTSVNYSYASSYTKFDVKNVPGDFMLDVETLYHVNNTISKHETGFQTQSDIDGVYNDWCNIISHNMNSKLPSKVIKFGSNNKKRRPGKPWWSDTLTEVWNNVCIAEKAWLSCADIGIKKTLKTVYIDKRKLFDRQVQRAKRLYWFTLQTQLLDECKVDSSKFWKSVGKIGVNVTTSNVIPMEVVMPDGSISNDVNTVLDKWKHDFSSLFNTSNYLSVGSQSSVNDRNSYVTNDGNMDPCLIDGISVLEVRNALMSVNKGKACGVDNIPVEVLNNDASVSFLHVLFSICFDKGIVPSLWSKCIINPIPKSSTADKRDPLSYRGISLASSMYKLYCHVLNSRLSKWSEENNIVSDEQNGFRKRRSTTDHIMSLYNILDTRKKSRKSTICAFIDVRKAYDTIDRNILWNRLSDLGIGGKMFTALKSIYNTVSSCVRVNSLKTEWFDVDCGLRQGCILSPLLFNLFINDLSIYLKSFGVGVPVNDDRVCIIMYADDIVLLAESADEMQLLLSALGDWCSINNMHVNSTKSNIVHFRPNSVSRTTYNFVSGSSQLTAVDRYTYLGVLFHEHLDLNVTVKSVAQSASRALGLLIAKCKIVGGLPYDVFTKLYDAVVWPVVGYSAPLWGYRSYACIEAVHNRAQRYFLGVGKYTPNDGLAGEMGWKPPIVRQWKSISLYWSKIACMDDNRFNKRAALWAYSNATQLCKNWFYYVKSFLLTNDLNMYLRLDGHICARFVQAVEERVYHNFKSKWYGRLQNIIGSSGHGQNKLRLYRTFKSEYVTEQYCKIILPLAHRSAFSKFRLGVAPIHIETGRYEGLNVGSRICPFCGNNSIESELHVMLHCYVYNDLREDLYTKALMKNNIFSDMQDIDKYNYLFSSTDPTRIRTCAKTCYSILQRLRFLLS